jgi:hypothetical protein
MHCWVTRIFSDGSGTATTYITQQGLAVGVVRSSTDGGLDKKAILTEAHQEAEKSESRKKE